MRVTQQRHERFQPVKAAMDVPDHVVGRKVRFALRDKDATGPRSASIPERAKMSSSRDGREIRIGFLIMNDFKVVAMSVRVVLDVARDAFSTQGGDLLRGLFMGREVLDGRDAFRFHVNPPSSGWSGVGASWSAAFQEGARSGRSHGWKAFATRGAGIVRNIPVETV